VDTLRSSQPDEIYNQATMSYVAASWLQPTLTAEFTRTGVTHARGDARGLSRRASTIRHRAMFGMVREVPQT